jgi:hypothetical protein
MLMGEYRNEADVGRRAKESRYSSGSRKEMREAGFCAPLPVCTITEKITGYSDSIIFAVKKDYLVLIKDSNPTLCGLIHDKLEIKLIDENIIKRDMN